MMKNSSSTANDKINEFRKIKLSLTPKVKPIPTHMLKQQQEESQQTLGEELIKNSLIKTKLTDLALTERKLLFEKYYVLYDRDMDKFICFPFSRLGSSIYVEDRTNERVMLIFGGVGKKRLNELWEMRFPKHIRGVTRMLKWKENKVATDDLPLARIGNTCCYFRNDLVVYGGVITNEDSYYYKDNILFFNMKNNKMERCNNELF